MLERLEMSDGLGAIYPGIMNSIIALRCLGYSLDDPQMIRAMDEFEALGIEEEERSACSPASRRSGTRLTRCSPWAKRACRQPIRAWSPPPIGCCKSRLPIRATGRSRTRRSPPGGWYFEFNNEFYPDVDDTAQVILALNHVSIPTSVTSSESVQRALALGAGHAVPGRRLGVLRQGQHAHGVPVRALRRPQRHDGPADGGHHRARAGNAGHLRLRRASIRRCGGPSVHQGSSRRPTAAGSGAGA